MRNGKRVFLACHETFILDFNTYESMDRAISEAIEFRLLDTSFWIPADSMLAGL